MRRMFSADYRAAVAAEAAGDVELAAERYALAGELAGAVRMHLARAARAGTRIAELAALRDALRWAGDEPALRRQASNALGRTLWESVRAEGIATERDRGKVREAAELLVAGDNHALAGEALETIGDHQGAAHAYSAGGLVEKMEAALAKDDAAQHAVHEETDAFAGYQTAMHIGRRDEARSELARAIAAASAASEYRRLLDRLDTALLSAGKLELRRRGVPAIVVCAAPRVVLGRDPLCDLSLRAGGVSRQHAEIEQAGDVFRLRDLDSRNGTSLAGLRLAGAVPLVGAGQLGLGDECAIDFETLTQAAPASPGVLGEARVLVLKVRGGLDRGVALVVGAEGVPIDLGALGLPIDLTFQRGRPLLGRAPGKPVMFNDEPLGDVRVQLIRGDRLRADGDEIEVA
ncbi:MAG TPA: FHA domain-containing protein [Kofleriaceae bacterium]